KYDGDGPCLPLQCRGDRGSECEDHVRLQAHQFFCEPVHPIDIVGSPTYFHAYIAAIGPTQFGKPLGEPGKPALCPGIILVERHERTDAPPRLALLRMRGERPRRRRAAEQRDEPSPPQIEHQAAPALVSPLVSLPHRQPAAESPASPWGRSELF